MRRAAQLRDVLLVLLLQWGSSATSHLAALTFCDIPRRKPTPEWEFEGYRAVTFCDRQVPKSKENSHA